MKRPELLTCVALVRELPDLKLGVGDVGVVVELFEPDALMVEFMDTEGDTVAIVNLKDTDVRSVPDTELQHAAPLPPGVEVSVADATKRGQPGGGSKASGR